MSSLLPYLCLFLSALGISCSTPPIAETPLGKIRGHRMLSRAGREFLAFSGLPYAKPPLGELRFEPPEPADRWTGVRDALEDGPWCAQYDFQDLRPAPQGREDCLYLSVYTHTLHGRSPVLVHFHGGAFVIGSGPGRTGPQYLMDEELVVVDVNYRLSSFGFLSFEDSEMPGNQGLKDQVMALRWVQENIASFGGDPSRVTIVGESAGGVSVTHHTVSPLSKGLFHRGIAESGTSYVPQAVPPRGLRRRSAKKLLSAIGCERNDSKIAASCLKQKDVNEILNQTSQLEISVGPCLEPPHPGAFLVGPISQWEHQPVPLIVGMTSGEGLLATLYLLNTNVSYEEYNNNFTTNAQQFLYLKDYSSEPKEVVKSLRQYYFPKGDITEEDFVNLTMIYTDSSFTIGIIDAANEHTGDVYFYYFDYFGKYSFGGNPKNNSFLIGAYHMDEMIYLWQYQNYENLEGEDLERSKKLVKLWASFASKGSPAANGGVFKWNKWASDRRCYLDISKEGFKMQEGLAEDRYRFWKTLKYRDNLI